MPAPWPETHNGKAKHAPAEFGSRVVPGFTRKDLARLFGKLGLTRGAEIGVADGRNSLTLCEAIPDLKLICVDPWAPYKGNQRGGPQEQHDRNYAIARKRLAPYDVTFMREQGMKASRDVPMASLDFAYVDANHAYEFVLLDLVLWSMRVRSGGIVAGHDFYHFSGAGVVEAVVRHTEASGITDWHLTDEREPSFWWVQP